jgi:hypothetical protein
MGNAVIGKGVYNVAKTKETELSMDYPVCMKRTEIFPLLCPPFSSW